MAKLNWDKARLSGKIMSPDTTQIQIDKLVDQYIKKRSKCMFGFKKIGNIYKREINRIALLPDIKLHVIVESKPTSKGRKTSYTFIEAGQKHNPIIEYIEMDSISEVLKEANTNANCYIQELREGLRDG